MRLVFAIALLLLWPVQGFAKNEPGAVTNFIFTGASPNIDKIFSDKTPFGNRLDFTFSVTTKNRYDLRMAAGDVRCPQDISYCAVSYYVQKMAIADSANKVLMSWPAEKCLDPGAICDAEPMSIELDNGNYLLHVWVVPGIIQYEQNPKTRAVYYCYPPGDRLALESLRDELKTEKPLSIEAILYYQTNTQSVEQSMATRLIAPAMAASYGEILKKDIADCE